jgi:hypothetical protein
MDGLKAGWKTSEFWTTLVVQAVSLTVVLGLMNHTDSATLTDSLTAMVTAAFSLMISGSTAMAYIKSRFELKAK